MSPADACCSSPRPLAQVLEVLRYAATYVALTLVFLGSPVLFSRTLQAVPALLRRGTGMYTASERSQEMQLRQRFIGISLAFFAWYKRALLILSPIMRSFPEKAILNPLSGFLLMLAFSTRRSSSCARRMTPPWRSSSRITKNSDSLPEDTSDSASGFLMGAGTTEASSLLASLDTSTPMEGKETRIRPPLRTFCRAEDLEEDLAD